jgi:hypothetical protein
LKRSAAIVFGPKQMPKCLAEFEYGMNLRKTPDVMFAS